jgi:hypothetical protein
MSFLTLSHLPFYLEGLKGGQQPQDRTIYGAGVVEYQFVKALLQHGKHERYYFTSRGII